MSGILLGSGLNMRRFFRNFVPKRSDRPDSGHSEDAVSQAQPQSEQPEQSPTQNLQTPKPTPLSFLKKKFGAQGADRTKGKDQDQSADFVPNLSLHTKEFSQDYKRRYAQKLADQGLPGYGTSADGGYSAPREALKYDLIRLGAAMFTGAIFGMMILKPQAGPGAVKTIASTNALGGNGLASKSCRPGEALISSDFTDFSNVLSISPLGGVTAPGEILPAPYIRINTRSADTPFQRQVTNVKAPATAEIVAIERKLVRSAEGEPLRPSWRVHFKPCSDVQIVYDRVDDIDLTLLDRAGGLSSFDEIGGPTHLAKEVRIKVASGAVIGTADGFDVALHDQRIEALDMARPERYRQNAFVRADVYNVEPSLLAAISPDHTKSRCALDYLRPEDLDVWSTKLGDAWGIRRARGENACRTALISLKGTAQGAWYTDAAHNGATSKISAIALAPDTINPDRLIFALHGRLPSLTNDMVSRADLGDGSETSPPFDGVLTFEKGTGRINRPFSEIRDGALYCYQGMRVNFIGPRVQGVVLLQRKNGGAGEPSDGADMLKIEARHDLSACDAVPSDFEFSAQATGFFR